MAGVRQNVLKASSRKGYLSLKVHLPSERGRVITASSAYDKGPGAQKPDEVKVSRPVW
jgi:hypothetical protein